MLQVQLSGYNVRDMKLRKRKNDLKREGFFGGAVDADDRETKKH